MGAPLSTGRRRDILELGRPCSFAAVALVLSLLAFACESSTETPVETPDVVSEVEEPPALEGCLACASSLVGKTFRIATLEVIEPSYSQALLVFLNDIWQQDVIRHILNILMRINTVDTSVLPVVMSITGGSGWHDVLPPQKPGGLPATRLEPGQPLEPMPTEYDFLADYTIDLAGSMDEECHLSTVEGAPFLFHTGPLDSPTICSHEFGNAIPIHRLVAHGTISDDCKEITDGYLEGCIKAEDACTICSWGGAPDYSRWSLEPEPDVVPEPCAASYCKRWCGAGAGGMAAWQNFGGFLRLFAQMPLNCDASGDGTLDGYKIAGLWQGHIVETP